MILSSSLDHFSFSETDFISFDWFSDSILFSFSESLDSYCFYFCLGFYFGDSSSDDSSELETWAFFLGVGFSSSDSSDSVSTLFKGFFFTGVSDSSLDDSSELDFYF